MIRNLIVLVALALFIGSLCIAVFIGMIVSHFSKTLFINPDYKWIGSFLGVVAFFVSLFIVVFPINKLSNWILEHVEEVEYFILFVHMIITILIIFGAIIYNIWIEK